MKEFDKTLKLYHFLNRKLLTLSVRCSSTYVLTFFIKEHEFEGIKALYNSENGYEDSQILIHQKRHYIRITKFGDALEHNLRVPIEKWEALMQDHTTKTASPTTEIIACEIE